jgi:hypothetical protein
MKEDGMNMKYSGEKRKKYAYRMFVGKVKGRDRMGNLSADRKIILKLFLEKYGVRVWSSFIRLVVGASGALFESGNVKLKRRICSDPRLLSCDAV